MSNNPKRIVFSGYDEVADIYVERFGFSAVRQKSVGRLVNGLPAGGGRVLDLGCGAGIPVARDLAALGHAVVGVDGSTQQVLRARRNVPKATFIKTDMCEVAFEVGSFDAVGAFYSITHVPPAQQDALIANIAAWLKPGGMFVASFGAGAAGEWAGEWLGTTMFFGHTCKEETLKHLADSELKVRDASVERQDNEEAAFMWIEAVKAAFHPGCVKTQVIPKARERSFTPAPVPYGGGRPLMQFGASAGSDATFERRKFYRRFLARRFHTASTHC